MQKILTPELSVIVTAYNNEKYVQECLDSILAQTFTDYEIIVVDAGSKDKTAQICHSYSEKYTNITVVDFHPDGPAASRNEGMKYASGKYITFVDGDDVIDKEMYSTLIAQMEAENLDAVYCTCYRFFNDDINNRSVRNIAEISAYTKEEIRNNIILPIVSNLGAGVEVTGSMCMSVYRKSIIDANALKVRNMSEIYSEDNFFNIEYLSHSERAKALNIPFYYYRKTAGSISNIVHDYTVPALKNFEKEVCAIGEKLGIPVEETSRRCNVRFVVQFSAVVKKKIDSLSLADVKKWLKATTENNNLDFSFTKEDLSCVEFQVKLFWILLQYRLYTPLYLLVKIYSRFIAR
ncbi:MAG: glycosyltransferase [Oscillospiraceae bacterium]|nr:glycosyltransferase [Oscillospiraceae bacterium]